MKKIYLMCAMFISAVSIAQVGINTESPDPDSDLTLASDNKGLLLNRVALAQTTDPAPLSAHVAGMTVYNTATSSDVTPGQYYNDGTKWVRVGTGAAGTEPWLVQNTTDEATDNTENIYQTGKVAIGEGFDGVVSTKQLEVMGDFKSQITDGTGVTLSLETNNTSAIGQPANIMFSGDTEDVSTMTYGSMYVQSQDVNMLMSKNSGDGTQSYFQQTSGMQAWATGNATTTNSVTYLPGISQSTIMETVANGYNTTQFLTDLQGIYSRIYKDGTSGVTGSEASITTDGFRFTQTALGSIVSNYLLPKTNGTLNQVLVTNGVAAPGLAQLSWADASSLLPAITANNGLTKTANNVQLGGSLVQATTINQAAHVLNYTGTAEGMVKITNTAGTSTIPKSALQIQDGSQGAGKVLTSDASGNASWKSLSMLAVPGTWGTTINNFTSYGTGTPKNISMYTSHSITLPPGKWMVHFGDMASLGDAAPNKNINTSDAQLWCTGYLTDSPSSSTATVDYITAYGGQRGSGGSIGRGMNRTFVSGAVAINNASTGNKTYYLWANQEFETYTGGPTQININGGTTAGYWVQVFGLNWERYFYALPIQ